jgi:hypothetical protein
MTEKEKIIWKQVVNGTPAIRKEICKRYPKFFSAYYFSQYFKFKTPDFHNDLYKDAVRLTTGEIEEVMWCLFRESAKTSIAKIIVCWLICYKFKTNIKWDSYDDSSGDNALFDITVALQSNQRLISDFGNLYHTKKHKNAQSEAKRKQIKNFITENGVSVSSITTQQATRSKNSQGENRTDFYVVDDFENYTTKESFTITNAIKKHLDELRSGLPAGASVLYLCNYITDTGSVAYLMEEKFKNNPKAIVRFIPIVDIYGKIVWTDKYVKTDLEAHELNKLILDPKLHKTSLESKRRSLGDVVYETEMMLNPSKSGELYFDRQKVDNAIKLTTEPIDTNVDMKIWEKFSPRYRYGSGADTAEGIGADSNASAIIRDRTKNTPALVVATFEDNQMSNYMLGHELKRQGGLYGYPYVVPELNNTGYGTVIELINAKYPLEKIYRREVRNQTTNKIQKEFGWKSTTSTKSEIMGAFKTAFEEGDLVILDSGLLEEMRLYTKSQLRLSGRQKGATRHYDKLRATALAWHALIYAPLPEIERQTQYTVPGQDEPYKP